MRLLIILIFLWSSTLFSIDVSHYYSESPRITGIHDSEQFGLIISNSEGVFRIDKRNGNFEKIPFDPDSTEKNFNPVNQTIFFKYMGELHSYSSEHELHRVRDGKYEVIASYVVAHLVSGDKLYILRSIQPRVQIFQNDVVTSMNHGSKHHSHETADLVEVNGSVYGLITLRYTKDSYIFLITYKTIGQRAPGYVNGLKKLLKGHDRLWCITREGVYEQAGIQQGGRFYAYNYFKKLNNAFHFNDHYIHQIEYQDGKIFGINDRGFFVSDIYSRMTEYKLLAKIDHNHNVKMHMSKSMVYFMIDERFYSYNISTEKLKEYSNKDNWQIILFTESVDGELLLVRGNTIEWYKDDELVTFGGGFYLYSNEFYDVAYDKITNKIVALGRLGKYFALQTFDGKEWGLIHIPFTLKPSSSGPIRAITVEVDLKGNYYVAIHEFLGKWDGEKWVRMTLTNTADSLHEPYMERYRLPVVDSAGGVWIGAKINEYMAETDDFELREFIARIDGDNVEVIDADLRGSTIPNGICKRNGDVIMDTFFEDIYYFRDLEIEILSPDDGDDHPDRNTSKGIYTNKNDDLVVVFESGEIWTSKYGTYYRTGGIAVYQNGEWDYDKYGDIVKEYELEMNSTVFLSDTYGYEYIITAKKFIRIANDGSTELFEDDVLDMGWNWSPVYIQVGNEVWFPNRDRGIFRVKLPTITNGVHDSSIPDAQILRHEIIRNNTLELLVEITNYQIYSVLGRQVMSGASESRIDVSDLSSGTYFIVCTVGNEVVSRKFVVSR